MVAAARARVAGLAVYLAGVTVGLVALPLAMAFAIASGLPPQNGLYCAVIAGFTISALGPRMMERAVFHEHIGDENMLRRSKWRSAARTRC